MIIMGLKEKTISIAMVLVLTLLLILYPSSSVVIGKDKNITQNTVSKKDQIPSSIDAGTVQGTTYKTYVNKYFGMSVQLPMDWEYKLAKDYKSSQANKGVMLEATESDTLFKSSFLINISPNIFGMDGKNTAEFAKKCIMQLKEPKYSFRKNIYDVTLGGVRFSVVEATASSNGVEFYQDIYITIRKGYRIMMVKTWIIPDQEPPLDNIIKSVKFGK